MRFTYDGVRIDKSTGFENKRRAEAYAEAFRTKLRNGEVGLLTKIETPLFDKAIDDFFEWAESRLEKSTIRRYKGASVALIATFSKQKVDKITAGDIETYITKRSGEFGKRRGVKPKHGKLKSANKKKKISASTINKELAVLKKIFNNLINAGVVRENPVKPVKFLKEFNKAGRVLNYDEEQLYLSECSDTYRDFVTVLAESGLRPDELCELNVSDINLDEGFLSVRKGKTKAATRTVPLSDRASETIRARIENLGAQAFYLFPGGRGANKLEERVLKFNNSHYGVLKRSKIDGENRTGTSGTCTIYSFRHTFATRFVEAGGDIVTLAALLGHSSLRMVTRYAHPSDNHKFEAIQRMAAKRTNSLMQKTT